ncbi:hypothetical protein JTE90_017130 [Oedothorax gibbosus]|uniref:Reticulocalbin-3 n=1 Tax=Oedothorax gibbosus TaxID=931172 RepID=A0AAV6UD97_9ARAC|nr:hypothetical protein JTE90_017130 [Oedothorax gibbosus]
MGICIMATSRCTTLLLCLFIIVLCKAVPNPDSSKRVLDKPLSDEQHYENEAHNPEYDHEAFLGKEEAKEFEQLSPEESKERLAIIVDKIDKDKDGFASKEELKDWISYTQMKYIQEDVNRQWESHNEEKKETLDWEAYKKFTYNFMEEMQYDNDDSDIKMYKEMMQRDKRRWSTADKNGDGSLSKEEFQNFLHPEHADHMKDIVVTETIEDIDKDGDGKISLEEYIGDMYSGNEEDEPEWVKTERESFAAYRDKNNDGFMDKEEVKEWIIPEDFNHSESEALHLIHEADENKDYKLSKDEILNNYDVFVGSQATDFGSALTRHDEF